MLLRNRGLGLLLVVVLATATACGGSGEGEPDAESSESGAAADVPEVVAEVNGVEISKEDFVEAYDTRSRQAAAQAQGGQPPDEEQLRDQVVQSLVNQELLTQEADEREIEATDEQVQQTLQEAAEQSGLPSVDEFVKALEGQGMDREEIDAQAAQQARFDLLVADEAGTVKASEKEVRALYQQLKSQQQQAGGQGGQQLPPFGKVRPQLEAEVESQEQTQAARDLLDRLREDGDITVNL